MRKKCENLKLTIFLDCMRLIKINWFNFVRIIPLWLFSLLVENLRDCNAIWNKKYTNVYQLYFFFSFILLFLMELNWCAEENILFSFIFSIVNCAKLIKVNGIVFITNFSDSNLLFLIFWVFHFRLFQS